MPKRREWTLWRLILDNEWVPQVNVYAFEGFSAKKFLETHVRGLGIRGDCYRILPASQCPKVTIARTVKEPKP